MLMNIREANSSDCGLVMVAYCESSLLMQNIVLYLSHLLNVFTLLRKTEIKGV